MTERFEGIFEFGPYRPKHDAEPADPAHFAKSLETGETITPIIIPVKVYGPKPQLSQDAALGPSTQK